MITIKANRLQDGLYNIKNGKIFKYKAKGGTVRTYDMGEIVLCKDCEYRNEDGECDCNSLYMQMEGDSSGVGFVPEKDFYCAYGKRREDGE